MAYHKSTCIVSCSRTASGTSSCPFATFVARRQQLHCFFEIFLYMVKHSIISTVGTIKSIQRRIAVVICDKWRILVIANQIIIRQATQEKNLSLDTSHFLRELTIIITTTRNGEIANINSIIPFSPRPPCNV